MIKETIIIEITGNSEEYYSKIKMPGNLNVCMTMAVLEKTVAGMQQRCIELLRAEGFKGGDKDSEKRIDQLTICDLGEE